MNTNVNIDDTQIQLKSIFDQHISNNKSLLAAANDVPDAKSDFKNNVMDGQVDFDANLNPELIDSSQEAKLRFVMQVVQQQATGEIVALGPAKANDPEIWVQFFARYPLLFNLRSRLSKTLKDDKFSLNVNSELVSKVLPAKTPEDLKNAFVDALKSSAGEVFGKTKTETNMQFLALVRTYDKASTLTIYRAEMKSKVSEIKTTCGGTKSSQLDIIYDEITLEINNELAIGLYPALSEKTIEIAARELTKFAEQMADKQFKEFKQWLESLKK